MKWRRVPHKNITKYYNSSINTARRRRRFITIGGRDWPEVDRVSVYRRLRRVFDGFVASFSIMFDRTRTHRPRRRGRGGGSTTNRNRPRRSLPAREAPPEPRDTCTRTANKNINTPTGRPILSGGKFRRKKKYRGL